MLLRVSWLITMVQIRRRKRPPGSLRRFFSSCLQFVTVSSVIPATFWARHYIVRTPTETEILKTVAPTAALTVAPVSVLVEELSSEQGGKQPQELATAVTVEPTEPLNSVVDPKAASLDTSTAISKDSSPATFVFGETPELEETKRLLTFLQQLDWTQPGLIPGSDVVELFHCNLDSLDLVNFTNWASPIVNNSHTASMTLRRNRQEPFQWTLATWQRIQEEFTLELLEMRAQALHLCDFELYRPALPMDDPARQVVEQKLLTLAKMEGTVEKRIVFVIVAYHDSEQLRRLVEAVNLPQHYILIHLERRVSPEWEEAVIDLASTYDNVIPVKFGSIVYETDSVSMIHYRIMNWLIHTLDLPFGYYASLDGASFPLVSAADLVSHLVDATTNQGQHVWMGSLRHKGALVDSDQTRFVRQKRLFFTGDGDMDDSLGIKQPKLTSRIPRIHFKKQVLSDAITETMTKKTNSGNQAVYSRTTVEELSNSPHVRELFALAKYGCCCCLEERTWIAAMGMIDRQVQALEQAAIWQCWGGIAADCKSSMKNAVLTQNASLCYKVEDGTWNAPENTISRSHGYYFHGNETWAYLRNARERGILFVRKFDQTNPLSVELQVDIEELLWTSEEEESTH